MRRLRCAGCCRPRPSASSSELSLPFLLSMSPSTPPESPPTARTQFFVGGVRLRPPLYWTRHSQRPTLIRFTWNPLSGSPGSLIRYNLLSCLPPLADLTRHSTLPSRRRLLLPSFRPSRLPFSPSDISTVASGHLHRQDSHLLERQLASLHEQLGFEPPRPVDFAAGHHGLNRSTDEDSLCVREDQQPVTWACLSMMKWGIDQALIRRLLLAYEEFLSRRP